MLDSLFNKAAGLQACNFIKTRLHHKCFPVNIAKVLRTPIQKIFCELLPLLFHRLGFTLINDCYGKGSQYHFLIASLQFLQCFEASTIMDNKVNNLSKIGQKQKSLITISAQLLTSIIKVLFLEGRMATKLQWPPVNFDLFLRFPKFLSLKWFSNSFSKSYTIFVTLDIKYHFTCCE